MGSDQYRRELAQVAKDIGKVRSDIGAQEETIVAPPASADLPSSSTSPAAGCEGAEMYPKVRCR